MFVNDCDVTSCRKSAITNLELPVMVHVITFWCQRQILLYHINFKTQQERLNKSTYTFQLPKLGGETGIKKDIF